MAKKSTREETIAKFRKVWGGRYDYSLINEDNYIDTSHKIPIICTRHQHKFYQTPSNHLQGHGCPLCADEIRKQPRFSKRGLVCGIGVFDCKNAREKGSVVERVYKTWQNMLERCNKKRSSAYKNCQVCKEWELYSNFESWLLDADNGYKEGYNVDKDILVKNNNIYSPSRCLIVPPYINHLFVKQKGRRNGLPIGVQRSGRTRYVAILAKNNIYYRLGTYSSPEEAFNAYKVAKEAYIKEVAIKYYNDGKIARNVYDALMNYKVEITD